jgi:NAD+ dependent glucose-6-phosphate dehydrogenase
MPERRVVAVTGAAGIIGGVVRRWLSGLYELRLTDRVPLPAGAGDTIDLGDVEALAHSFSGASSVVHLAAASAVDTEWPDVLSANLIGTYNVFEAARRSGVGRVVFASSSHVVGMYERDDAPEIYRHAGPPVVDHLVPPRPDSLYGVSKGYGELLGRLYAERHGLRVVCLRIGTVLGSDDPTARAPSGADPAAAEHWVERMRATWLSHRDCAELIRCALEADVRYAIAYGVSDVPGRFWDLEHARRTLGYEPRDTIPTGA